MISKLTSYDAVLTSDCVGIAMDLVFVLDGSGSICDTDPNFEYGKDTTCDNWEFIVRFVADFVTDMDISPSSTRIALVTFATDANVAFDLTKYADADFNCLCSFSMYYHI